LAAGVLVFFGLVLLGDLTGLLWRVEVFGWSIRLNPHVVGPTADWVIWGLSFLISISPGILVSARSRTMPDHTLILAFFVFPLLSLVAANSSHLAGGTLLIGSGFIAAYALVSRSRRLLGIDINLAARLVCAEVFAFLSVIAAGGILAMLLWGFGAFTGLTSGSSTLTATETWLRMLAIDVEVSFLPGPLALEIFIIFVVAAVAVLFREPVQALSRRLSKQRRKEDAQEDPASTCSARSRGGLTIRGGLPYAILAASIALGIAITLYPYTISHFPGVLGSDSSYYLGKLRSTRDLSDAIQFFQGDRGFFLLLLFLMKTMTGLSPEWVVRLTPAVLSALLALSSFMLVREGTGRSWVAALASLLSVVSAQTALGMSAGIITNWFGLSLANLTLALVVRWIRLHSRLAAAGSLAVSLILLLSYAYMWVVLTVVLVLALFALLMSHQTVDRYEWKQEVKVLSAMLLGSILIPTSLALLVSVFFAGPLSRGFDPVVWLTLGWNRLAQGTMPLILGSALPAVQRAFDDTANRIYLPFLTLLSVLGMLDQRFQARSFNRLIAAMVLASFAATLVSPGVFFTWRGLYIIPVYLTGALGAESVIRRASGAYSPTKSPSRLAFAGAFVAYLFLSQLDHSLRALQLLIMIVS